MLVCLSLMPGLCTYVWGGDIKIGAMSYGRVCFVAFKYKHHLAKIKSIITCLIFLKPYFV